MENVENNGQDHEGKEVVKPSKRVRGRSVQVKPCKRIYKNKVNVIKGKGSEDLGVYKRLCNVLSHKWDGINSREISILCGWVMYLQTIGKMTGNKDEGLRWLGFRLNAAKSKQVRWLEQLCDKGYLLRVQYDAGAIDRRGHGYGLTEYGQRFLNDLDKEYDIARQWLADNKRLTDIVIYLDRVKEQLHPRQRALFTPKQIEQLKAIGKL